MKLSRKTIALLALNTAIVYLEGSGQQKKAATARAAVRAIERGVAVDEHMAQVAEMIGAQEGVTDEQWDEQTARIESNTDTAIAELDRTAGG